MSSGGKVVSSLGLVPLPLEGGSYGDLQKRFCSPGMKPVKQHRWTLESQEEPHTSSIFYLLEQGQFSSWHRNQIDEYWCYHKGGTIRLHLLSPDSGEYRQVKIGDTLQDPEAVLQFMVGKNIWMAGELEKPEADNYCLLSCITVPEFNWAGYEDAKRAEMKDKYPEHSSLFDKFCRH